MLKDPDALPQLIGESRPLDEWQGHMNELFYGLRGSRVRDYSQSFAAADYRLAHALAADYYDRVRKREKSGGKGVKGVAGHPVTPLPPYPSTPLVIQEWGPGNGNLAACFLSHLKRIDKDGLVYPRVRYVLVDRQSAALESAGTHPDLAEHRGRVMLLRATAEDLGAVRDRTVDRILCHELWNELRTKLMLRNEGEIEEEYLCPNLSASKCAAITDWSGFVRAFAGRDLPVLKTAPSFLEDMVWEKEYRKAEWKSVPYRKTITEFLKTIDERVLVPVNLGAFATLKEAKRVLAPDAIGLSSFDAGTADQKVLNDPDKPCYGQFGGQYSFMVNFALVEAVARYLGFRTVMTEPQREFIGRSLGTNVLSLMDLLATHPSVGSMKPWERDRLILRTIAALNETYASPYGRTIEFPISEEAPPEEREALQAILQGFKGDGVPDTIAYLTEEELVKAFPDLEPLGYDQPAVQAALAAPPQAVDYAHCFVAGQERNQIAES
jgi:hypothetical protein